MNGNIPGWDFNGLSPFGWLAARNVLHPERFADEDDLLSDAYLDEFWPGEEKPYSRTDDPRFQ